MTLEGHARLTAYMLCPDALPPELEVLVGSSPKMAGWGLYEPAWDRVACFGP